MEQTAVTPANQTRTPEQEAIAFAKTMTQNRFSSPEILTEISNLETKTPAQTPVTPDPQLAPGVTNTETTASQTEVKTPETKTPAKPEVKTPGYKSKFGFNTQKEAPAQEIKIETMEQAVEFFNSKFGLNLKSPEDLPKIAEPLNKWRNDSQKLTAAEKRAQDFETLFNELPQEYHESFELLRTGKDHREAFRQAKLDFNKKADQLDVHTLVDNYFPGQFSKDDLEAEDLSPAHKAVIQAATDKFNSEKQSKIDKRAALENKAKEAHEAFTRSVSSSVESLKVQFPDADQESIAQIEQIVSGGMNSILGEFFNRDGTLKATAAENLMWMKYGKDEIQNIMAAAQRQAETKVTEDFLTRGADTKKPVQSGNGAPPESLSKEDQKFMEMFLNGSNKNKMFT